MIHKRIDKKTASRFSEKLLHWHKNINRHMPWVGIKDPYKIWLSEIILQQTRVEQGKPYYLKFIRSYPTVNQLASASIDEVLKLWQGLGYYSRARNLHLTAQQVSLQHKGVFPSRFEELIKLKGIGEYTAAAISSFSSNEPHAVVDGNVIRVLSRVFGIKATPHDAKGKKLFRDTANLLLDPKQAGKYNQAIMDFGALVCMPQKPKCAACVFRTACYAFTHDQVNQLPLKKTKTALRPRYFHYFYIHNNDFILLSRRESKDIWQGLFEFPLIETDTPQSIERVLQSEEAHNLCLNELKITLPPLIEKQKLSHQEIHFHIYRAKASQKTFKRLSKHYKTVRMIEAKKKSFPKTLAFYINNSLSSG